MYKQERSHKQSFSGWRISELGLHSKIERGRFSHRPRNAPQFYGGTTPFVQTGDVSNSGGRITQYSQTLNELGVSISKIFPKGTILMTIAANIGDCGILEFDSACPDSLVGITPSADLTTEYLLYFLIRQKSRIHYLAPQGAQKNINVDFLKGLPIPIPSIREQQQIAEILSCGDCAIEKLQALIAAKTRYKRGLMQQLLTGRKRFPKFAGQAWNHLELSDFAKSTSRIKPKPDKPFKSLGIRSHGKGTFLKNDFEPQKIELTELFEVQENDLIVNITFAWEGAIAIVGAADSGALVSHRFPTFVFDTELAIPEYFRHIIVQKWFVEKLGLISPGGAGRNRVLSKKDFGKLEVLLPSVAEQRKIAAVLNACDREIRLLNEQLAALKTQKQGLMQKLLTGQVRVRMEEEPSKGSTLK